MHPAGEYVSAPWGRDIWSCCGLTSYDRSAQVSGKVIRPDEFGFALESTPRWLLSPGELVSCGNRTMADPSRAWSNSMARSHAEKHLTAWVSPCMQENTYQHADSEAHVQMFL